jgi:uncharacterized membrane protein
MHEKLTPLSSLEEDKESPVPRPSIENLSNLIFGLALSIGAIALLGQQAPDLSAVLRSLITFGFGFLILLIVWYRYSTIMKILPVETSSLVTLNLLLLFLVAIEPYLLNLLTIGSAGLELQVVAGPVSQIYALDLGTMFLVLTYFLHQVVVQEKKLHRSRHLKRFRQDRAFHLIVAAAFYISILPFPASFELYGLPVRQFLWLFFLPVGFVIRIVRLYEARNQPRTVRRVHSLSGTIEAGAS